MPSSWPFVSHLTGYTDPFPCMQPLTAAMLPNHNLPVRGPQESIKMAVLCSHHFASIIAAYVGCFSLPLAKLSLFIDVPMRWISSCKHFTRLEIGVPGCQGKGGSHHASFRAAPESSIHSLDHSLSSLLRHHCAFAARCQSYLY